ncbi:MAG: hypothetical protein HFJ20_01355 [Clostridia bacterium]|nr:hypothetical protein [Clostridia bacterium]
MGEDKCKKCIMNDKNKKELVEFYVESLKNKPSTIGIIAFGMSWFALGITVANIIVKLMS